MHQAAAPFAYTAGPHNAGLVVCAEAFGETEERYGRPLVGQSGRELFRCLGEAWEDERPLRAANTRQDGDWIRQRDDWLASEGILLTNVFAFRPQGNNLGALCASKGELPSSYALPQVRTENPRFVRPEYLGELERLKEELHVCSPNLILALGGTACWATIASAAIGSLRGAVAQSTLVPGLKVLPAYHPTAILRQWGWRPVLLADLLKARRERQFAELVRPARGIIVSPSIEEVETWTENTLRCAKLLAPDIETLNGQIRCIGFARSASEALVVPFVRGLRGGSYWESESHELRAWHAVRQLLESPIPKVGQNFLFDLQYLSRMGIRPRACQHDTMLLHHVLYPEMQKGLGFLGSVYTNESSWKLLRKHGEELKRDE